jgi:DNA-binding protein HU-beta
MIEETNNLKKMELVREIANRANIQINVAQTTLEATIEIIKARVAEGYRIALGDFGVFEGMAVKDRLGVNPRTKEHIKIPGHTKIAFRPAQAWKDMVKK